MFITDADDEWHLVARIKFRLNLECGAGGRRDTCDANVQLVPTGGAYRAVADDGTVLDENILKAHGLVFTGDPGNFSGTCGKTAGTQHAVTYVAFLEKAGSADEIVGETLFSLNTACDVLEVAAAAPSLVIDSRNGSALIDRDASNLDGDGLTGFFEDLQGTSDEAWDSDGDGVSDDLDEAPADRKCHTACG